MKIPFGESGLRELLWGSVASVQSSRKCASDFLTLYAIIDTMSDKIIHTFQQRRQLEQAIADFAHTQSEAELAAAARRVVHTYPAEALTLLLKHLDTQDSQVRGGLGHLAALLPTEETTAALRSFVANRQHSPQARVTRGLARRTFSERRIARCAHERSAQFR